MKNIFLVDADDTILDFHKASSLALRNAFEMLGEPWKEEYAAEFKIVNDGLWEALERKEITRLHLIEIRFPLYMKHLGVEIDGQRFNELYLTYLATHPIYVDGAEEFLKTLNEWGRVFIVTNGTERIQRSRFDIAKLWDYGEDVFISDCIGVDKPAKGYTDYVISHIQSFDKEKAVWIGDSLSADIRAANEAEITSVWFNPAQKQNNGKATPDYTANGFSEILEYIKKLND